MLIRVFLWIGVLLPSLLLVQPSAEALQGRAPQDRTPINQERYECLDQCLIAPGTTCPKVKVCAFTSGAAGVCEEVTQDASFRCVPMEEGTLTKCDNEPENEWCFTRCKNPCDREEKPKCSTILDGCGSKFRCDT